MARSGASIGDDKARRFPTVVHMLVAAAELVPERHALVCDDVRIDYASYLNSVMAFAAELGAMAVRGERVATILPNGIESCIATFAIQAAGAQAVPLNPLYTGRELREILQDAEPAVLMFDPAANDAIASVGEALQIPVRMPIGAGARSLSNGDLHETPSLTELPAPDDKALLLYTGGTTGRAKGVELTHRAIAANVAQREGLLPTGRAGERILCVMPLFHSYALSMGLYLAVNCRGALIIRPRYQPDDLLATVEAEQITIFPGSPTIYNGLLARPRFAETNWSAVHTCYSGSAPLSEETLRRWEAAVGAPIYEGYGQTEAGPVLTFNPAGGVTKPGSVGIPVAQTTIEIVDVETGTAVLILVSHC